MAGDWGDKGMRCGGLEERVVHGWARATEQLRQCTTGALSTFPHFLYLYGLSPNAEFAKTI